CVTVTPQQQASTVKVRGQQKLIRIKLSSLRVGDQRSLIQPLSVLALVVVVIVVGGLDFNPKPKNRKSFFCRVNQHGRVFKSWIV
ncbi:MAG TPA: hypothetical protein VF893_05895, partial [Candidatus Bathyarchaeia archaeon]